MYVFGFAIFLILLTSHFYNELLEIFTIDILCFDFNRFVASTDPEAKITNIGDAFWWAMVTVTTVGYGDLYPVTPGGKIVASIMMMIGIAILGVLISTLGAGLIESRFKREDDKKTIKPSLADETKTLIKGKIDKIGDLNQEEYDHLLLSMKSLRNMLYKEES
jgi:voltage-gated potassium channel